MQEATPRHEATAKVIVNRSIDAVNKLYALIEREQKGEGAYALEQLKDRKQDAEYQEAATLLEELASSIFLVGGRRFTQDELANMTLGEVLATGLPNKIKFRIWPSPEGFRK